MDTATAVENEFAGDSIVAADKLVAAALAKVPDDAIADPWAKFLVSVRRRMLADSVPCNPTLMAAYIETHNLIESGPNRIHVRSRIHETVRAAMIPTSIRYCGDVLLGYTDRRRLDAAGHHLIKLASGGDADQVTEALAAVRSVVKS